MAEVTKTALARAREVHLLVLHGQQNYWFRAHRKSCRRVERINRSFHRAWAQGLSGQSEWTALQLAHSRANFCYRELAKVMGWWTR